MLESSNRYDIHLVKTRMVIIGEGKEFVQVFCNIIFEADSHVEYLHY